MLHNDTQGISGTTEILPRRRARLAAGRMAMIVAMGVAVSACGSSHSTKTADINTETKFSSQEYGVSASKRVTTSKKVKKGGGTYKIGKPYKIRGKWFDSTDWFELYG